MFLALISDPSISRVQCWCFWGLSEPCMFKPAWLYLITVNFYEIMLLLTHSHERHCKSGQVFPFLLIRIKGLHCRCKSLPFWPWWRTQGWDLGQIWWQCGCVQMAMTVGSKCGLWCCFHFKRTLGLMVMVSHGFHDSFQYCPVHQQQRSIVH